MGLLSDLTPLNILTQKEKFLADPKTNPIFEYVRTFTQKELTNWGMPKDIVAQYCLKELQKDTLHEPGVYIDKAFIQNSITQFNNNYQLKTPLKVEFSAHFATKCRVSSEAIYFQLPLRYTLQTYKGLYRHELETHILRRVNHLQNFGERDINTEMEFRRTEEGLANLHTHLFRKDKKIKKTFLSYYSTYLSQRYSFCKMFSILLDLGMSKDRAWNLCLRNKRGLVDTSQPGGFTKDICYLEGTIQVWEWIMNPQNDPKNLYIGRINLDTADQLAADTEAYTIISPTFLNKREKYLDMIAQIGEVNKFEELKGIV